MTCLFVGEYKRNGERMQDRQLEERVLNMAPSAVILALAVGFYAWNAISVE
jgi:hypothetical protein